MASNSWVIGQLEAERLKRMQRDAIEAERFSTPVKSLPYSGLGLPTPVADLANTELAAGMRVGDLVPVLGSVPAGQAPWETLSRDREGWMDYAALPGEMLGALGIGPRLPKKAPKSDIFAGQNANTADNFQLSRADQMAAQGADAGQIWSETGWWVPTEKGPMPPGGAPRFEIPEPENLHVKKTTPVLEQQAQQAQANYQTASDAAVVASEVERNGIPLRQAYDQLVDEGIVEPRQGVLSLARSSSYKDLQELANQFSSSLNVDPGSKTTTLAQRVDFPELYAAYPDLQDTYIAPSVNLGDLIGNGSTRGTYYPGRDKIELSNKLSSIPDRASVFGHEVMHAIQHREPGFSEGGAPESAKARIQAQKQEQMRPYFADKAELESLSQQATPYYVADALQGLDRLVEKPPRTPYQLMKRGSWYPHSDTIRGELGAAPNKPGAARDEWVRKAALRLRSLEMEDMQKRHSPETMHQALKALEDARQGRGPKPENRIKTFHRKMDKAGPGARAYQEAEARNNALLSASPYRQYQSLGGEAEARAVQARMGLTPEQRRQIPPWESYDVSVRNLIR